MKRRNFLKRLFATGVGAALASVPAIAKVKEEETFTLDDMFEPCDGNKNLFYLKTDSWLESEIRNELGDRFVDERYFACYYPLFNLFLPVKDTYTRGDFTTLLLAFNSHKFDYFCDCTANHGKKYGAIRIYRKDNNFYSIDMYQARNPKNNGAY